MQLQLGGVNECDPHGKDHHHLLESGQIDPLRRHSATILQAGEVLVEVPKFLKNDLQLVDALKLPYLLLDRALF